MADSCSETDSLSISDDDSEFNYIPGRFFPIESEPGGSDNEPTDDHILGIEPYSAEPLADEKWLEDYNKRQEEKKQRLQHLQDRLTGKDPLNNWCSCGHCRLEFLQNAYECCCCREFEESIQALNDEWVLQELKTAPSCITLHPAYNITCLERWSLRLSAGKYRTIDRRAYRQTGSEEAFLRSVAYREYTHLVYDKLGKNRIPLPACAYNSIRNKFQPKRQNESFTGFQEDDSDKE